MSAGPLYPKIHTVWKRDERGLIIPGDFSLPEVDYLAPLEWSWTEKIDGTNLRLHWDGETVTLGGRTNNAQIPATLVDYLIDVGMFVPDRWHAAFPTEFCDNDVTMYGEGYGAGIQKGGGYGTPAFIAFDCLVGSWWLKPDDLDDACSKLNVRVVPRLPDTSLIAMNAMVEKDLLFSEWPDVTMEGVVGRPMIELKNRRGERLLVKIKTKDYDDLRRRS
jgi:hypothetical protein